MDYVIYFCSILSFVLLLAYLWDLYAWLYEDLQCEYCGQEYPRKHMYKILIACQGEKGKGTPDYIPEKPARRAIVCLDSFLKMHNGQWPTRKDSLVGTWFDILVKK